MYRLHQPSHDQLPPRILARKSTVISFSTSQGQRTRASGVLAGRGRREREKARGIFSGEESEAGLELLRKTKVLQSRKMENFYLMPPSRSLIADGPHLYCILPMVTKDLLISPRFTPYDFFIAMQVQHSYNSLTNG